MTSRARFGGKTVLVTGAASGIGRGTALAFAEEGAAVVATDVDKEGVERLAGEIRAGGGTVTAAALDVTSSSDCVAVVDLAVREYGGLDVAFANAGIHSIGRAHEVTDEEWQRVLAVDLTGSWNTMRAALGPMLGAGSGTIVCTASVTALSAVPATAAYTAAKAGVAGLVRQMAIDYAALGIRVNAICPGSIRTPLLESALAAPGGVDMEEAAARYPMARLGTVEEITGLVLFLSSEESGFITGQAIAVDGGLSSAAWLPRGTAGASR